MPPSGVASAGVGHESLHFFTRRHPNFRGCSHAGARSKAGARGEDDVEDGNAIGMRRAARRDVPPKPVADVLVLDPGLQGAPPAVPPGGGRVGGKPNPSCVTFPDDPANDERRFRGVVPFTRIAFIVGGPRPEGIGRVRGAPAGCRGAGRSGRPGRARARIRRRRARGRPACRREAIYTNVTVPHGRCRRKTTKGTNRCFSLPIHHTQFQPFVRYSRPARPDAVHEADPFRVVAYRQAPSNQLTKCGA